VRAELVRSGKAEPMAISQKEAHVLSNAEARPVQSAIGLLGASAEIAEFLTSRKIHFVEIGPNVPDTVATIFVAGSYSGYRDRIGELTSWVSAGNTLVLIEPEQAVVGRRVENILEGLELSIERRADVDRGGFDSYLFASDHDHPLWAGIRPEHLKMFNGGFGGEVVSQHDVVPNITFTVLARCGLKLKTNAVFEMPIGIGRVIVSRLQLRGRLASRERSAELYARRNDPVLQRYLLNLLHYASSR
jgi:hypothetical protein